MAALTSALEATKEHILATAKTLSPQDAHAYRGELEDWIEDEYLLSADHLDDEPGSNELS